MNKLVTLWIAVILLFVQAAKADTKIFVTNLIDTGRDSAVVEVNLGDLPIFENVTPAIYNDALKIFVPSQLLDKDEDGKMDEILFLTDIKARQTQTFTVHEANASNKVEVYDRAAAYYVPQRKDDFAWENDKIAFRIYGQELQRTELTSSGIDVWVKKSTKPVMPLLYRKGHDYYHSDNPYAIDFFNVAHTLGCGGIGVWSDGKLLMSENYDQHKVIANGPIRAIFEVSYKPWDMGDGRKLQEIKRITLDKGCNFSKIESRFDGDVSNVVFAPGIVKCDRGGKPTYGVVNEYLGYWQEPDKNFGVIGCGVILDKESITYKAAENPDHYLLLAKARNNNVVTYYAGACWNQTKGYKYEKDWNELIRKTSKIVNSPLKVEVKEVFVKKRYY
jgi:hypothetical protein